MTRKVRDTCCSTGWHPFCSNFEIDAAFVSLEPNRGTISGGWICQGFFLEQQRTANSKHRKHKQKNKTRVEIKMFLRIYVLLFSVFSFFPGKNPEIKRDKKYIHRDRTNGQYKTRFKLGWTSWTKHKEIMTLLGPADCCCCGSKLARTRFPK